MIKAILIINNHGKPRLTKFYEQRVRAQPFIDAPIHRSICHRRTLTRSIVAFCL